MVFTARLDHASLYYHVQHYASAPVHLDVHRVDGHDKAADDDLAYIEQRRQTDRSAHRECEQDEE